MDNGESERRRDFLVYTGLSSRPKAAFQMNSHVVENTGERSRTALAHRTNRLILLVEDNEDDEVLTLDALKTGGITNEIAVVRDGAEALEYLFGSEDGSRLPAVVVLDLRLPKVPGLEVLRRIRAAERTKRLPVVVLTSSDEQSDLKASYGSGANSYVRKPVRHEDFVKAVQQLGLYWLIRNEAPVE